MLGILKTHYIFCLFFLVNSCATVSFYSANNRFISPEAGSNSLAGRVGVAYAEKTRHELARNLTNEDPIVNEPRLERAVRLSGQLQLTAIERWNFYYGPNGLGTLVQFYGPTEAEAKPEDISLSVSVAVDAGTNKEEDEFSIGTTKYKNQGVAKYSTTDFMLIGGYRSSERFLWYSNLGYMLTAGEGEIIQYRTDTTTNQTTETKRSIAKKNGNQSSALFGIQIAVDHFYMMIESGLVHNNWPNAESKTKLILGGIVGVKW